MKRPLPTGAYAVGTTTFTVYTDRDELRAPGTKRSVPVRVYYPVQKGSVAGMDRARYMSRNVAEGLRKAIHVPIPYDKREAAGDNVSECYTDAPRIEGAAFPLVVFNHGLSSYRESNSFLCIELASQGYVILAVGHPYDACCAELDDGTCIFFDSELSKKQYDPLLGGMIQALRLTHSKGDDRELAQRFDQLQQRYCKLIISRVLTWEQDTLDAVRYAREQYGDLIDFRCGIAATGHSLGGATAYALCLEADDNGRLTNRMRAGDVNFFSCGEVAEASSGCKSFTNPTIDGTKLNRSGGKVIGYEVYGAFGQFEGNSGSLCFSYSGYGVSKTPALQISTDFAVKSPMGSNYERYFLRSSMRGSSVS